MTRKGLCNPMCKTVACFGFGSLLWRSSRRRGYVGVPPSHLGRDRSPWTIGIVGFLQLWSCVPMGCSRPSERDDIVLQSDSKTTDTSMDVKIDAPNQSGYRRIRIRQGDLYKEGVVDAKEQSVVPTLANMLVIDITDAIALVQVDRKFLFVPLDQGSVSEEELLSVSGFQYAAPYRCGLALVVVNDEWFYINKDGQQAFPERFDFAETFHYDRALVKRQGLCRIIDVKGKTVAELRYDQVNPQSPQCWQVTNFREGKFWSGFVDLDGVPICELMFESVGYYDEEVQRTRVGMGGKYGFVNERAQLVIPLRFEYAEDFHRGSARVAENGRWFLIDPQGQEVAD